MDRIREKSSPELVSGEETPRLTGRVLMMPVDLLSMAEAVTRIMKWSREPRGRMICAADVHMVMRHYDESQFRDVMAHADLIVPDGMSLVWTLKAQGWRSQTRVCGPDLMLQICECSARDGIRIGLLGGRPEVLERLEANLGNRFQNLQIVYRWSPPFRPLDSGEASAEVGRMEQAGVQILFVGLGCPKQERWIAEHLSVCRWPMLGVGAAFDFHSGAIRRAPGWIQKLGLEWLFRFAMDPKRLWKRALYYIPRFMWLSFRQLIMGFGNRSR